MPTRVFVVVLLAALLHAVWNAAVKHSTDRSQAMLGLVLGHAPFALLALLFAPVVNWSPSWPYVVGGALLHIGYQLFLTRSYRRAELTQVYPIARGTAPLLTALLSSLLLGERLSPVAWAGVTAIAVGLMSLVLVRRQDGIWDGRSAAFALATGCFTAGYSLSDGVGARVAGSALGFYGALSLLNALIMGLIAELRRPGAVVEVARGRAVRSLLAGGASFTAFSMIVWAFTRSPIALVAALRETSVIFALLIGVFILKERLNLAKVAATAMTTSGVLLVRTVR